MASEVKLPRLGQGMESGTIVRWLKSEGEPVAKREPLYELDTDKVTQEVEAEADGVLLKIVVPDGEVAVGTTIAVIGQEGEEIVLAAPPARAPEPAPAPPSSADVAVAAPEPEAPRGAEPAGDGRVKASPLARRIARERGIELAGVRGTGPDGRVIAEDLEKLPAGGTLEAEVAERQVAVPLAAGAVEVVKLTSTRKTIARRLSEAWTAPVFQLAVSVNMTQALALRARLVEQVVEGDVKPTVSDVLTKLTAVALTRHSAVNATFSGDEIQRYAAAHVGLAVAAPNGLVVPVIRDAHRLTIQETARARADVVARARDGKLARPDLEGGTFTISNLGMYGVEQFVAILNPPQVAILAVGAAKDTPIVVGGEILAAPMATLTLTCDHRAIDGAEGAEFLRTLVALVEQPALAL